MVRALVLELSNTGLNIPNGLVYTCDVAISPDAPFGEYALVIFNVGTSAPDGLSLPTTGTNGAVLVVPCTGDCDTDGQVTVDELILGLVIAQEQAAIDACPAIDTNGDGRHCGLVSPFWHSPPQSPLQDSTALPVNLRELGPTGAAAKCAVCPR